MDNATLLTAVSAIPGIGPYLPYIAAAIAVCAAVATALPHPAAPGGYATLYAAVNFVALNFGKARNAPAAAPGVTPISTPNVTGTIPALLGLVLLSGLAACTGNPTQDAATVKTVLCLADANAQPIAVALAAPVTTAVAPGSSGVVSGIVALDQSALHPAVVSACAGVGVPVAAVK